MSIAIDPVVELVPSLGPSHERLQQHVGEQIASLRSVFKRTQPFLRAHWSKALIVGLSSWYAWLPSRLWDWASNSVAMTNFGTTLQVYYAQNFLTWFSPAFAA